MAATVFLAPGPFGAGGQFFTPGGIVLNGGLLNTYLAGSSTPQPTFTTNSGAVQNANPIVLNSDGRPPQEIWLSAGISYKFVLTDSLGSLIANGGGDNLYGINDPAAPVNNQNPIPVTSVAGTANAITGAIPGNITAFAARQIFSIIPGATNTGATAIVLTPAGSSALASRNIFLNGAALAGGELRIGIPVLLEDDGTELSIIGPDAPIPDSQAAIINSTDLTKKVKFSAAGITTATTRTLTVPNQDFTIGALARSYLAGLGMSTAGGSATMTIAAGQATDSTNAVMMTLAAAISKTTSAWVVGSGNGGLDTGSIANTTWYKFFEIMRLDTGVVDVIFTTAALVTGPAMPTNYTRFRYLGSGLTNGAAQWVAFIQDGDLFQWLLPVNNVNTGNPGATALSATLTTPLGVNVVGLISGALANGTTTNLVALFSDLAITDSAPDALSFFSLIGPTAAANNFTAANFNVRTNTASQIRYRLGGSTGASDVIIIATKGWIDRRGRDS